ncbi:MAG TPA: AN1-type zinc finger domain-containing protein [Methanoregula sp.]|nr:AN1-type zinc finger domain-containing protein [Methanoregula sp.]
MTRCDHCGNETTLPFTCQHCGGKFCPDCRLPPNHDCTGIGSWNRKPRPAVGMSYSRGGGVSATGGTVADARRRKGKKAEERVPYLKIMIAIIVLILLGFTGLLLAGFRF